MFWAGLFLIHMLLAFFNLIFRLLSLHVVILLELIVSLVGIDFTSISVDWWRVFKGRIAHHFAESFIDFDLGYFWAGSHELGVIGCFGESIVLLLFFFGCAVVWELIDGLLLRCLLYLLGFVGRMQSFGFGHAMLNYR